MLPWETLSGQLEEASRELLVVLCSYAHYPHPDQDPQRQECGSRSVVSTGAGRKQISMGPPGPWNLSVWPVPREGGVWLLAGAREQGWNKPRCPSQVMVSSP